ncbi:uncharacterized protein LOC106013056 [Aplysia californica]|uniref:Uncharacterized protein LOC106013056 n=1 Tax=Aplysia californica TaxID=6500 RepID=A0ABM1A975_APLCA|nr:uncharacterized protein LOC106013056 [Aplysia californica]
MKTAAKSVSETSTVINPGQTRVPATTISFDGTWHKRGHSSHFGVGVVIDCKTGFVLDYQVLSNYCHGCEVGLKSGDEQYLLWKNKHQLKCQQNFQGSAKAMEAEAAVTIFRRSVQHRGLVYSRMLCDGDARSHQLINTKGIYDFEVIKEDCINHISKRRFNALENTKNSNKKELNRKLTKTKIEKITNTYATNLKQNAPDTEQVQSDVYGGIYHMLSTDDNPQHHLCPTGISSWCHFQRALATKEEPRKHTPTITEDVAKFVWPVVERLTRPDVLKRCVSMQTQNANECFNSLIWSRCTKTRFASLRSVETATALSVLAFNCGPSGLFAVLEALNIPVGGSHHKHQARKTGNKLKSAMKCRKRASKWGRKDQKGQRLQLEKKRQQEEGDLYEAGAFNL